MTIYTMAVRKVLDVPISEKELHADLKTSAKAALPTLGEPKVMHRTSEVGLCKAAQHEAMVARDPPTQNPVSSMRRGVRPPACGIMRARVSRMIAGSAVTYHMHYKSSWFI